jgi:hypothetical protein
MSTPPPAAVPSASATAAPIMHELVVSAAQNPDSRMIGEQGERGDEPGAQQAVLRVVAGGEPAPDELAALVVAVASAAAATPIAGDPAGRRRGGWSDRSHGLRRPLRAGAGGWRAARN